MNFPQACAGLADLFWMLAVKHEPSANAHGKFVVCNVRQLGYRPGGMMRSYSGRHLNSNRGRPGVTGDIQQPDVKVDLLRLGGIAIARFFSFWPRARLTRTNRNSDA